MREAGSAFGDSTVYLEKYIPDPRHIEFQIFCDEHGNAVHLGERECSIQRRHQKIIEETPSVALTPELRSRMGEAAVKIVMAAGYVNAGTVEFLLDGDKFYFLEVNTRLQVEHPVTESVTGEDLVLWQLSVASGEPLPKKQNEIHSRGHSMECRIYAEDPGNNFLPSSGKILVLEEPHIPGVRVDSGIREGSEVSVFYDPILSKVIATAENRERAIEKMLVALNQYVLLGVASPIEMLRDILLHKEYRAGNLSTHFLDKHFPDWKPSQPNADELSAALFASTRAPSSATAKGTQVHSGISSPWQTIGAWQIANGAAK
jgi:acetyl/propionyl-CoA carboxylase alpha subunit